MEGRFTVPEVLIIEFNDATADDYQAVNSLLGFNPATGAGEPPQGLIQHTAAIGDHTLLVAEVWESQAAQGAFLANRLGPALGQAGVAAPSRNAWFPALAWWSKDSQGPLAMILEFPGFGPEQFRAVLDLLKSNADGSGNWPAGMTAHIGASDGERVLVVEQWASAEAQEAAMRDVLIPALTHFNVPPPARAESLTAIGHWAR